LEKKSHVFDPQTRGKRSEKAFRERKKRRELRTQILKGAEYHKQQPSAKGEASK